MVRRKPDVSRVKTHRYAEIMLPRYEADGLVLDIVMRRFHGKDSVSTEIVELPQGNEDEVVKNYGHIILVINGNPSFVELTKAIGPYLWECMCRTQGVNTVNINMKKSVSVFKSPDLYKFTASAGLYRNFSGTVILFCSGELSWNHSVLTIPRHRR